MSTRRLTQAKIVVLGASGVGKSAFVVRYITKRFIGDYEPNKENFYTHKVTPQRDDEITLSIVDTSSQSEPEAIREHISSSNGIVLIYSIVDRATLHEAHTIRAVYLHNRETNDPLIIVGNKCDLADARTVSESDGKELAAILDSPHFEISVADAANGVADCMNELVRQILREHVKVKNTLALPPTLDNGRRSKLTTMKNAFKRRIGRSRSDTF